MTTGNMHRKFRESRDICANRQTERVKHTARQTDEHAQHNTLHQDGIITTRNKSLPTSCHVLTSGTLRRVRNTVTMSVALAYCRPTETVNMSFLTAVVQINLC